MSMIELRTVSKSFGRTAALTEISLAVEPGETVLVCGPSGAGKTTLLRLIAGLEQPDTGEIHIDSELVSRRGWAMEPHRRGLGYVMQTSALWPHMTVIEHLQFVVGGAAADEKQWIAHLLDATDLTELAHRRPTEISGGEARRVALARALVGRPRTLLLDEPLNHLEFGRRTMLRELISTVASEVGAAVLYVSHHPDEAEVIADRTVHIEQGRIRSSGRDPHPIA